MKLAKRLVMRNSGPWSLAAISPFLWLDPNSVAHRNIVSGKIFELYDVGGNGRAIGMLTESLRPGLTTANLNGKDIASYDGSNDYIRNSSMATTQPRTYAAVAKLASVSNNPALFDGVETGGRNLTGFNTSREVILHAGATLTSTVTITLDQWFIIVSHFNGAFSWCRLNGVQIISGNAGANATSGVTIGDDYNLGNPMNGAHGQVAIMAGSILASTVEKIEGRFAHDYALTALLPSDHPYKTTAP